MPHGDYGRVDKPSQYRLDLKCYVIEIDLFIEI
jgi:hypothetical protein